VLRTIDGGAHWAKCAVPDGAKDGATLDFRDVQAFDARTAFVMSSGKGKLSRLYLTVDGCKSWKLNFANPDNDGFWDTFNFRWFGDRKYGTGWLLGEPVKGMISLFASDYRGRYWTKQNNKGLCIASDSQRAFATNYSSLFAFGGFLEIGSGGTGGASVYSETESEVCLDCSEENTDREGRKNKWIHAPVPLGHGTDSSEVMSIGARPQFVGAPAGYQILVIVGGDSANPHESHNTAAFRISYDQPWIATMTPPHGFRSAVEWSESLKAWITVGANGSDISRDDGKTWQSLDNGNWNALSLPYVVGPNGRIARINPAALPAAVTNGIQSRAESSPNTVK
jgi:hypothetical protein